MFIEFELHERLMKALEKLKYSTPTPVQTAMIPLAMAGKDIQTSAETGSGKTAAFLLPVLHRLLENPSPDSGTRCLVLLPTRELANQVFKHCEELASFTHTKCTMIVGGASFKEQRALIRKNPEIVIGTPGRLLEHVEKKSLDLSDLEVLILDEADRMLDMGFREDVIKIINECNKERQTMLLSATLRHEGIGRIAKEVLQQAEIVDMGSYREKHSSIEQQIILADDLPHKDRLTTWLLANEKYEKVLIFANTKVHVDKLAGFLKYHKNRVGALHGDMTQDERNHVMQLFRTGGVKVLVATDLAARGLDVKGVDLVINYAMARSGDEHVHRIGRTGRAGETGLAISLISPQEWNLMSSIERYLGLDFERRLIKELEAKFKGPNKKKAAKKVSKKDIWGKAKNKEIPKAKQRHSFKKNIGKRRKPSEKKASETEVDGFAPLKKK
ncbi:DEAD/DEAH box helicase [Gammaproteobacteria bacterium]|nr:DEAD/DEAH box helicase [Gammaproteobacteria bacterium]